MAINSWWAAFALLAIAYNVLGDSVSSWSLQAASRGITQNNVAVATTSTAAASAAFGSETYQIRIAAASACTYKVGDGTPTAASTDAFLPAPWVEYVKVTPGQKVSVWSATVQTISVTEMGA